MSRSWLVLLGEWLKDVGGMLVLVVMWCILLLLNPFMAPLTRVLDVCLAHLLVGCRRDLLCWQLDGLVGRMLELSLGGMLGN
jgi:hypothetical protein